MKVVIFLFELCQSSTLWKVFDFIFEKTHTKQHTVKCHLIRNNQYIYFISHRVKINVPQAKQPVNRDT